MSIISTTFVFSDFEEKRIGVPDFVVIYSFWRLTRLLLSPKFVMLQDNTRFLSDSFKRLYLTTRLFMEMY
jgi:hypothetical protein